MSEMVWRYKLYKYYIIKTYILNDQPLFQKLI